MTKELCELAIQQNYHALQFVKNLPSVLIEEICISAVKQNGLALKYVKNLSSVSSSMSSSFLTEDICKLAIEQNSLASQYVKKQTRQVHFARYYMSFF